MGDIKEYIVTVEIGLGDSDPDAIEERVKHLPFGDHDMDFRIVEVREGQIPAEACLGAIEEVREGQEDFGEAFVSRLAQGFGVTPERAREVLYEVSAQAWMNRVRLAQ